MASSMDLDFVPEASLDQRLALQAVSSLSRDLKEAFSTAASIPSKAKARPIYDPTSLHPLSLSSTSLQSTLDSARSSLAALKRSLIGFDASILSPANDGQSHPQDPKLSKLFSLLRESAGSAANTIAAKNDVQLARSAISSNSSKDGAATDYVHLPPALLAPLPLDPESSADQEALRILLILEAVAKTCGLVTLLEAPSHTLTLAGSIMVLDIEASPSPEGVSPKVKFSYSFTSANGGENGHSEAHRDEQVESRLSDLVKRITIPIEGEEEGEERESQTVLQTFAKALKELRKLDEATETKPNEEHDRRADYFSAMRRLLEDYQGLSSDT